ncbi:MAG: right-handed parallel beta-helix repeat-containing protein [Ruminococcaceae bacterium]|nr:right-handed parallel beta-helix repeat-containing protein [Oscillospiraceae bacterium]
MKRIIAFVLVICMAFGMIVTVSAAPRSSFSRTLNLVRLIRAMFSQDETAPEYGELDDGVLTIYVATNGKNGANGTEKNPLPTIESARDIIRTLDKSDFDGINVIIKKGIYIIDKAVMFTAEDSGTKSCPITYIGEEGAVINGGVHLTASDFASPDKTTESWQYFPEEVKDKLVMLDLHKLGYKAANEKDFLNIFVNLSSFTPLYCESEKLTVARYPNDECARVREDGWFDVYGETPRTEVEGTSKYYVPYYPELSEKFRSWHDVGDAMVWARLGVLWAPDNSQITDIDYENSVFEMPFVGGYCAKEAMFFYFYHVPEELDIPGEYYIDEATGYLYLYPKDNHATASYSMPKAKNIIKLDGTSYVNFKGLTFEASNDAIVYGDKLDSVTIDNCTVRNGIRQGIEINGTNLTIQNSFVRSVGRSGIEISGGDVENLIQANNLVYNNLITDWSNVRGVMESAIKFDGSCGLVISNNEMHSSVDWGIGGNGAYVTIEYNYLHDLATFEGDGGAIHVTECFGTVIRYNLVDNIGYWEEDTKQVDNVGVNAVNIDFDYCDLAIYGNIFKSITGDGAHCPGPGVTYTDNLHISVGRSVIQQGSNDEDDWAPYMEGGEFEGQAWTYTPPSYALSDKWLNAFPGIKDIVWSATYEEGVDNRYFIHNNGNATILRNFTYFDKANRLNHNVSDVYAYKFYEDAYRFDTVDNPTQGDGIIVYTSKRSGHPTYAEAIKAANEWGCKIPMEILDKIGRIGVGIPEKGVEK